MATPRIADQIGRVLGGRYRLIAPIGTGASAHVYTAIDITLGRRVAVKVLHPALAGDESFLRRFRAEARAVAALRHPHIMQVYDWGEDEDGPYLVLEHFACGSLRDLLDAGHRLTSSQALQVGLEAARGLDHAHRRGLVHRDIKPANLLFDEEGRLAIADFGLARALAEAAWTEPSGAVLGTARYAAPEQARGASVDGKADVYALALTIVEAVTGQVPFAADTTIATLMARLERPMDIPAELGPLVPAVTAAGATDPSARADAGSLARQLEAAAADLPRPAPLPLASRDEDDTIDLTRAPEDLTMIGPTGTHDRRRRVFDIESDDRTSAVAIEPIDRPRRRWRWPLLVVLLVAVIAAAGFGVREATTPRRPAPELAGRSVAEARQLAARSGFEIREARGDFYREDVEKGVVLAQTPLPGDRIKEGDAIRIRVSDGPRPREVPDLAGKTRADAQRELEALGLSPRFVDAYSEDVPKDMVVDWSPRSGSVPRGSAVTVTISRGRNPKPVPGLAQRTYDEAARILQEAGFTPKKEEAFDDKVAVGQVIATKPAEATPVEPGSEVVVVVSKGPETIAVPDVGGMTVTEADERLRAVGLLASGVRGSPTKLVVGSNPGAGSKVKKGSGVELVTR